MSPTFQHARHRLRAVVAAAGHLVGGLRWRGGADLDPSAGWQLSGYTKWGHRNDFAHWLREDGPEPRENATMNCVEAILFAAYRAGVVGKDWLKYIHSEATAAASEAFSRHVRHDPSTGHHEIPLGDDRYGRRAPLPALAYYDRLECHLHTGRRTGYTPGGEGVAGTPDIPAGHLVFFDGLTGHVALSLGTRDEHGRQEVLSLWALPRRFPPGPLDASRSYGFLQRTSVEELLHSGMPRDTVVEFATPSWSGLTTAERSTTHRTRHPACSPKRSEAA